MQHSEKPLLSCVNCGRLFYSPEDFLAHTSHWRMCSGDELWFHCACSAMNVIPKGAYPWYDPFARLSDEARSIFNQIPQIKSLPRLPATVMQLIHKVDDPNTSSEDLARIAKSDPFLAARILRVAESQFFARHDPIKSLSHAISLVGRGHVKEIALVAAISTIETKTRVFRTETFWDHSMTIGRIAEHLSKRLQTHFAGDEAYICGSLCNVGKLVMALCRPELVDQFQQEIDDPRTAGPWVEAEIRHAGFQHTVIGEIGAALWGLSESATEVIRQHHSVETSSEPSEPQLYELIGLANQFAHWIWLQPQAIDRDLFKALLGRFHIKVKDALGLAEELKPLATHESVA